MKSDRVALSHSSQSWVPTHTKGEEETKTTAPTQSLLPGNQSPAGAKQIINHRLLELELLEIS